MRIYFWETESNLCAHAIFERLFLYISHHYKGLLMFIFVMVRGILLGEPDPSWKIDEVFLSMYQLHWVFRIHLPI